ncbi:MAG: GMC family oxidoreductase N-terminal domain-containing protein [Rhizobiales bacterium]|nr:GMC family oxidoreductase N-terminal domain-containing protein [Hyphomicrobiales bacterium]
MAGESEHRYDYVIAGGGSAGCVVASRLVAEFSARVLLLEAGGAKPSRLLGMPAGYMKYLARDTYLTMHKSVPQPQLDGRAPIIPQAKLLGGGSAVNAMVYIRGQAEDYDGWDRALGQGSGWGFRDLLPHFKRQEENDHLGGEFHGTSGPLKVSHLGHHDEVSRAYIRAVQALGVPYNPDFNGARQMGVGFMQHTIDPATRRRCSAVDAFLAPVLGNPRLTVRTGARVTRILFDGRRAIGVAYETEDGPEKAYADAEVIVSAGSYISPKLLMLSGIGPAGQLSGHGIEVRVDLPGVGQNLQDHHEVPVIAAASGPHGYFGQDRGLAMLKHGAQYVAFRSGPVTTTGVEACAFIDPDGAGADASIQLYCVPTVYLDRDVSGIAPTHGVTFTSCLLRPKARGSVKLRSADPHDLPLVDCNFFGHPDDLRLEIAAMRFAREVIRTSPMRELLADEIFPGAAAESDEALADACRKTVKTNYHPVGTCRMGPDGDPLAVLDSRLRVRGAEQLRVIDASIMPTIVSGNTNGPTLALADRAVTLMMGEAAH